MNFIVRVFNTEIRNNVRDKQRIEVIGNRSERGEETPKATLNRFKLNEGKIILKFTRYIRCYNRFSRDLSKDNVR